MEAIYRSTPPATTWLFWATVTGPVANGAIILLHLGLPQPCRLPRRPYTYMAPSQGLQHTEG
jgi:hypothetical protein